MPGAADARLCLNVKQMSQPGTLHLKQRDGRRRSRFLGSLFRSDQPDQRCSSRDEVDQVDQLDQVDEGAEEGCLEGLPFAALEGAGPNRLSNCSSSVLR